MSQYPFEGLTGSGVEPANDALDGIPYAGLTAVNKAFGFNGDDFLCYVYDPANNNTTNPESSPQVIVPNDNGTGFGAWILQNFTAQSMFTYGPVGVGLQNPQDFNASANTLVIGDLAGPSTGLSVVSSTTGFGYVMFADGTGSPANFRGGVQYDHTNDRLALRAGSLYGLYIDSGGNMGAGILDPSSYNASARSIVAGSTSATDGITVVSGTTHFGYMAFADGTGSPDNLRGGLQYDHANDRIAMRANSQYALFIDSTGNVGIGINNNDPSAFNNVANDLVVGTGAGTHGLTIYSDTAGFGYMVFADGTGAGDNLRGAVRYDHSNNDMAFYTNNNLVATLDSAGQLGIGIAPADTFHVFKSGDTPEMLLHRDTDAAAVGRIHGRNNTGNNIASIVFQSATATTGKLEFSTSVALRMTIDAAGLVGIGAVPVSELLEVAPDTDVSAQIGRAHIGYDSTNTDFAMFSHVDQISGTNYAIRQDSTGETSINTASGKVLNIRQNNAGLATFNTGATGIRFVNYGAGTLTTDASGNISAVSDELYKEKIKNDITGLAEILQLNPISWNYTKNSKLDTVERYYGLSANDTEDKVKGAVYSKKDKDGVTIEGSRTMCHGAILNALINSIKTLDSRINTLEAV